MMHKSYPVRSAVFNLLFYILTGVSCIILLPTLFLPRRYFLLVVYSFVHATAFLEKNILGLTYEIRGRENLPSSGSFLVAAKHQSAYETMKLHVLFKDPAIVLKRELFRIPLWGWYLKKSDVIAIDRSSPKAAIRSIQDGAKRMAVQGRPIVIFPQGTRVHTNTSTTDKPYKIGIVRMQDATDLPIIPLALNTGYFWPRGGWLKRPGKVVFEFLPAVKRQDNAADTLKEIERQLEERSNALLEEAISSDREVRPAIAKKTLALVLILLPLAYTANWFIAAHFVKQSVSRFLDDLAQNPSVTEQHFSAPVITGFPGKLRLDFPDLQSIKTETESLEFKNLTATSWPVMGFPIHITAQDITFGMSDWSAPLAFRSFEAEIIHKGDTLEIIKSALRRDDQFELGIDGLINLRESPYPGLDMVVHMMNFAPMIEEMIEKKIIKPKPAMFAMVALQSLQKDGRVSVALTKQDNKIYLGPIRILELPTIQNAAILEDGTNSAYATQRQRPETPQQQ